MAIVLGVQLEITVVECLVCWQNEVDSHISVVALLPVLTLVLFEVVGFADLVALLPTETRHLCGSQHPC